MKTKKGKAIVAGLVITGLIGSNAYAFVGMNQAKDEAKEVKEKMEKQHEEMDVLVSQYLNKSSQYASHEDMIYSFNIHSASNRINYKGTDYYADIKHVNAHSFNEKEETKYVAQAEMTFLKDKSVDGVSYIQNKLPAIIMEETQKLAPTDTHSHEGHEGHEEEPHVDVVITQDKTVEVEKKFKEEFVVHSWNEKLTFNMDGQYIMLPTSDMEENIIKEFMKSVVLKEKGVSGKNADVTIDSLETLQLITVKAEGQTFEFKYNKDTKELTEQK